LAHDFPVPAGNKYCRNGDSRKGKLAPQFNPRHAGQVNVQHKTSGIAWVRVLKKRFGACEGLNVKLRRLQQTLDRSEHAAVIINAEYGSSLHHIDSCQPATIILADWSPWYHCPWGRSGIGGLSLRTEKSRGASPLLGRLNSNLKRSCWTSTGQP